MNFMLSTSAYYISISVDERPWRCLYSFYPSIPQAIKMEFYFPLAWHTASTCSNPLGRRLSSRENYLTRLALKYLPVVPLLGIVVPCKVSSFKAPVVNHFLWFNVGTYLKDCMVLSLWVSSSCILHCFQFTVYNIVWFRHINIYLQFLTYTNPTTCVHWLYILQHEQGRCIFLLFMRCITLLHMFWFREAFSNGSFWQLWIDKNSKLLFDNCILLCLFNHFNNIPYHGYSLGINGTWDYGHLSCNLEDPTISYLRDVFFLTLWIGCHLTPEYQGICIQFSLV